jgi:division protein CdvB (Snf7/Vps24/ESCRT-III family)
MMGTVQDVRAELVTVQDKVQDVIALVDSGVGNLNEDQVIAVAKALDELDNRVVDAIHNALALLGQPVPATVTPVPVTAAPTVAVTDAPTEPET